MIMYYINTEMTAQVHGSKSKSRQGYSQGKEEGQTPKHGT